MRTFNFRVTENLEPDDVFLIDGPGGTRTIKASDAITSNSDLIHISDIANNFNSDNVEGALAEVGDILNSIIIEEGQIFNDEEAV